MSRYPTRSAQASYAAVAARRHHPRPPGTARSPPAPARGVRENRRASAPTSGAGADAEDADETGVDGAMSTHGMLPAKYEYVNRFYRVSQVRGGHDMAEQWYWCLDHGAAERAEAGGCAPDRRLGPYASREEAENWKAQFEGAQQGVGCGRQGVGRGLSARSRAERALRLSEARYSIVRRRNARTGSCLPFTSTVPSGSTRAAGPSSSRVRSPMTIPPGGASASSRGREVDRVADRGERTDVLAADVADERRAGVDADADLGPVGIGRP